MIPTRVGGNVGGGEDNEGVTEQMAKANGKHQPWEPVTLTWDGREYGITSDRVMGAIHRVEDTLTFTELADAGARNAFPLGKVASAYANLLRYAGARVTDQEVYAALFGGVDTATIALNVITALMTLMLPPHLRARPTEPGPEVPTANPTDPAGKTASADG